MTVVRKVRKRIRRRRGAGGKREARGCPEGAPSLRSAKAFGYYLIIATKLPHFYLFVANATLYIGDINETENWT